ncbi:MAG: phenylalanine--tRNA ligase subunit beta [Puniceicoccales bacterium]|jgi:phenylalanyl-tRNA synthetase beta chain|nr:phenylalanine--tRNA ligase subunit beta [Puniceicoccales bacterium]
MKVSLTWLRRWLPDLRADVASIGEALPSLGLEVEEIKTIGMPQKHLVVGEVESFVPHPGARRLRICRVRTGEGNVRQIVCGASNFQSGDRVSVALPGCLLPNGARIEVAQLRGERSEGMLCSAEELRLSGENDGILILDRRWPMGTPLHEVFPGSDEILELSITANRGDCMSHLGIARELSAHFRIPLATNVYDPEAVRFSTEGGEDFLLEDLRLESANCLNFLAWSIRDVQIGPSPQWMRRDLEAIGMRSISGPVDITNWLMADCGQPLHAFDAGKIRGRKIHIRQAREGEFLVAINHCPYKLSPDMLILADDERPLVIAGTMGSVDAEVDESTRDIVLECAAFRAESIRLTSRKLGLPSDASQRFARGTDRAAMAYCARRAVQLLVEICGGRACVRPQMVGTAEEGKNEPIFFPNAFLEKKFGASADGREVEDALRRLHFEVKRSDDDWAVSVPPFRRNDVRTAIDLVEEFVRSRDLSELPSRAPAFQALNREDERSYSFVAAAAERLIGNGYGECYNYSTVPRENGLLALANPLSADQSHLRASLLPGLLTAMDGNVCNGNSLDKFFEIGRIWELADDGLREAIAVAWICAAEPLTKDWHGRQQPDFYAMKALARQLADLAGIALLDKNFEPIGQSRLWQAGHGAEQGQLDRWGMDLRVGLLAPNATEGIPVALYGGELRILPAHFRSSPRKVHYRAFTNFPSVERDLAVSADKAMPAERVRGAVERCFRKICPAEIELQLVQIFDVYEGESVGDGKKSIALRLRFSHSTRTLADEEITALFDVLLERLNTNEGFLIRRQSAPSKRKGLCQPESATL